MSLISPARRIITSALISVVVLVLSFTGTGSAASKDDLIKGLRINPLSNSPSLATQAVKANVVKDPKVEKLGQILRDLKSGVGSKVNTYGTARPKKNAVSVKLRNSMPEETEVHYRQFAGTPRQIKVKPEARRKGKVLEQAIQGQMSLRERDERTAREFMKNRRGLLGLSEPEKETHLSRYFSDELGRRHLRYTQSYKGLPVWPAEVNVHVDPEGNIDLVNGAYVVTPRRMVTAPVWTAGEALWSARQSVAGGESAVANDPELIIYAPEDRTPHLSWKIQLFLSTDAIWMVIVDAANGRVLTAYNQVPTANVSGSGTDLFGDTRQLNVWNEGSRYYMVDTSKPMFKSESDPPALDKTFGGILILDMQNNYFSDYTDNVGEVNASLVSSSILNSGWLADGVSLSHGLSEVYDYYRERHNRDSLDGEGSTIIGFVRVNQNYNNAFWSPWLGALFFGDAKPYAGAFDVVAHECTHGVTSYTCNLIYQNQSGALNEAFSDIFGEAIEAWSTGQTDWQDGTAFPAEERRSLSNPGSIEITSGYYYPSKMSEYYDRNHPLLQLFEDEDYGGVHINLTIISHCFYLLAEGMDGAIGLQDAEKIFYRAQTIHLSANSQFIDARLASITSAEELFGTDSIQAQKVAEAFDAVEIYDDAATPEPPPVQPVSGDDAAMFISSYRSSFFLARYEEGLGDILPGTWLSCRAVKQSRPSVRGDGSLSFFSNFYDDACFIDTNPDSCEECLGFRGQIHSVAMSPDGMVYGFVFLDDDGQPTNSISVIDTRPGGQTRTFPLVSPASEGVVMNTVEFADAMDFTFDNRYLVYDAYNVINFTNGGRIGVWSIYAIDLETEQTIPLVGPFSDADVGFPAMSQTTNYLMTFDLIDANTGVASVIACNLISGSGAVVGESYDYTVPGYNGDDSAIIYSFPDFEVPTGFSLVRQPLAGDKITPSGSLELFMPDADYCAIYRRGVFSTPKPVISASPNFLAFGNVEIGQKISRSVTISNIGTSDLTIKNVNLTGNGTSDFELKGGCAGQKLPASGTCLLWIDFSPTPSGTKSASLSVESDDPDHPEYTVDITGNATSSDDDDDDSALKPVISVSPNSLAFGNVEIGQKISLSVAISNIGASDLTIKNVNLTGNGTSDFEIKGECAGQKLPVSGTCLLSIDFSPTSSGTKSASLSVESDDPDHPEYTVDITGNATSSDDDNLIDDLVDDLLDDDDGGGGGGGCFIGAAGLRVRFQ